MSDRYDASSGALSSTTSSFSSFASYSRIRRCAVLFFLRRRSLVYESAVPVAVCRVITNLHRSGTSAARAAQAFGAARAAARGDGATTRAPEPRACAVVHPRTVVLHDGSLSDVDVLDACGADASPDGVARRRRTTEIRAIRRRADGRGRASIAPGTAFSAHRGRGGRRALRAGWRAALAAARSAGWGRNAVAARAGARSCRRRSPRNDICAGFRSWRRFRRAWNRGESVERAQTGRDGSCTRWRPAALSGPPPYPTRKPPPRTTPLMRCLQRSRQAPFRRSDDSPRSPAHNAFR